MIPLLSDAEQGQTGEMTNDSPVKGWEQQVVSMCCIDTFAGY